MAGQIEDEAIDSAKVERYNEENGNAIAIRSLDDIRRISNIFVGSNMFKGNKHASAEEQLYQAGVKIIAGVEFGIQPFAAMRGINIINGNAEMSANLMAAKVKTHPKYDYRVLKWDNEGCELMFYELPRPGAPKKDWDQLGASSFTAEDAKQAGLMGENWRKFARNMFFARAISNGVRIHCPDVFYGAPVYTEGEISGDFHEEPTSEPEVADEVEGSDDVVEDEVINPPVDQEPSTDLSEDLDDAKQAIYEELLRQGYERPLSQNSFIQKVIGQSKVETIEQAHEVLDALDNEKEE